MQWKTITFLCFTGSLQMILSETYLLVRLVPRKKCITCIGDFYLAQCFYLEMQMNLGRQPTTPKRM